MCRSFTPVRKAGAWIETGSQARTVQQMVAACGAELVGISVMVDQLAPSGRAGLPPIAALARFGEPPSEPD